MKDCPATAGFTAGSILIVLFLASCDGNEPVKNATLGKEAIIKESPLVVREWYPSPKPALRSTVYFDSSLQRRQQLMPQQTGSANYHRSETPQPPTAETGRVYVQQPVTSPWTPAPDIQQPSVSREHWATRGRQYPQRPWGESTHTIMPGDRSPRPQPQGVVIPYSTWQPGMTGYAGYPYASVPYGVFPGGGYPGFIW